MGLYANSRMKNRVDFQRKRYPQQKKEMAPTSKEQYERDEFHLTKLESSQGSTNRKDLTGTFIFKSQNVNKHLERRPYHGCFLFDRRNTSIVNS